MMFNPPRRNPGLNVIAKLKRSFRRLLLRLIGTPTPKTFKSGQVDPKYLDEINTAAYLANDAMTLTLVAEIRRLENVVKELRVSREQDQKQIQDLRKPR